MKINQDLRLKMENIRQDQKQAAGNGTKFYELVQKQDQKLQASQLQGLLKEIDAAGERLARSRTFKDLAKFKTLVKKFVKEAVEFGMELKQSHSWNQFGQGRSLRVVETVDEKLSELTDELMKKEESSIDILGKVGEIKGLLINLYT
ncbi:YaaR family protein [Bacillus sp. ISL-47]|uniref:YaaR family protein n=1 Tax=Bacillus sp. ISL-47 TaxID=2819130 RepID=UPI001BEC7B75|nr:YaaR family protein [Bacillus sp. ISL-47]MBT2690802.1 YaaR family protein [Bacillus sp. ISL-47]MBT2709513.1 YaaR family protein [Pseudomonas sp. ISL-84]